DRFGIGIQSSIANVGHDADDLAHGRLFVIPTADARLHPLSDRIFAGKELSRERVTDYYHRRRAVIVTVVEISALQNRNAQRPEIIGAGHEQIRRWLILARHRPPIDLETD